MSQKMPDYVTPHAVCTAPSAPLNSRIPQKMGFLDKIMTYSGHDQVLVFFKAGTAH